MRIIGYVYEADLHCLDCAHDRFGAQSLADGSAVDTEDNPVSPIWDYDEISGEAPHCGDCFNTLE